jgi:Flp pilus assembly protein TadB
MSKTNLWAYAGIMLVAIIAAAIILLIFREIGKSKSEKRKISEVINGNQEVVKISDAQAERRKEDEKERKKKKLEKNAFYQIYSQYIFFGGTRLKLILLVLGGWGIAFVVYLMFTLRFGGVNILASFLLSLLYPILLYMFLETYLKKKRMRYIKGFVSSLGTMNSSIAAGNSLETAIKTVSERENIYKPVKEQFTILSNNIISGIPLNDALESFIKRNYLFEEFAMFAIVIQFFVKSGGKNMKRIFEALQKSLSRKQENYDTIEGNLVSYTMAFDAFLIIEVLASFVVPFFVPAFYTNMTADALSIIKMFGSIILTLISVYVFKNSIRNAAEG